MLQSYHHITERSKYIREFERQKVFLEFFSEYTFEYKIVSLTVGSQFMCSESCIVCLHALEFTRLWLQVYGRYWCWIFMFSLPSSGAAVIILFEGLRAKRAYIAFLADFHFLQDRANFWQTDLFWQEKHRSVIVSVDLRFVLQK